MTNGIPPAARLLFVVDNDYGALGTVMYLLYRQPLSVRATLLLPRRAYEQNKNQSLVASRPYDTLQDILDVVESESPDVVFLFSGYLFASQGLLTIHALRKLIRTLRQRGCKVATSDPYLGTFCHVADADVPAGAGLIHWNLKKRLVNFPRVYALVAQIVQWYKKKKLGRQVGRLAASVKDVTHIYPVPMELSAAGGAKYISFFNPLYFRSQDDLRRISATVATFPGMTTSRPRWLFVLAQFDLEFQAKKHGKQGFVHMVASKLRQALDNGRHPTFVGPAEFVEEVSRHFTQESGVSLFPTCSFEEFEQRLLDAEMVFFWQIFSTSAFLRLWSGLPVFFFDRGHNAHLLRKMHEAGLKYYFMAGSPILLDIEKPLVAAELEQLGNGFGQSARDTRESLARLPSPEEMVSAIMNTV
jgi:hypothetical protein